MYPTRRLTPVMGKAVPKMIKRMMMKKKKGKVEKWSLQVETSPHLRPSSLLVLVLVLVIRKYRLQQIPRAPHQIPRTPLRAPHQIPWTPRRAPHQIPRTPLPQAPRQISSFYSILG